jgi:divalent metal cation (Fe/Co/Zn/Cd) transporter
MSQTFDAAHTVLQLAALTANSLIFCAKVGAWLASGGSALLAEAIHSLADVGNQVLLRSRNLVHSDKHGLK